MPPTARRARPRRGALWRRSVAWPTHFGRDPWRGRRTLPEIRGVAGALWPRSVAWPAHGVRGSRQPSEPRDPPECIKVHCAPSRHHQIAVFAWVYKGLGDLYICICIYSSKVPTVRRERSPRSIQKLYGKTANRSFHRVPITERGERSSTSGWCF